MKISQNLLIFFQVALGIMPYFILLIFGMGSWQMVMILGSPVVLIFISIILFFTGRRLASICGLVFAIFSLTLLLILPSFFSSVRPRH